MAAARVAWSVTQREFMPGMRGPWIDERRAELEDLHLQALECIAQAGIRLGGAELPAAEKAARALVKAAPYRESGYVHLMEALEAGANVAEALRVYDRVLCLLREELGVSPGRELGACTSGCSAASSVQGGDPGARATTRPIATRSIAPSAWPRTRKPASAATAGSSDISTPNTRAGIRRSDSSSSEYGITEEASATIAPWASSAGASSSRRPARSRRGDEQRADEHRDRQPAAAGEERPRARGERDVDRPRGGGQQRERDPGAVEVGGAERVREQQDPGGGERDPDEVARPARERDGQPERAGELDRDRDADRDPVHRGVDRPVHRPEREPEGDRGQHVGARVAGQARAPDGQQHERGDAQPEQRRARAAHLVEQRDGERRPDLEGRDGDDDERDPSRVDPHRRPVTTRLA